MRGSWLAERKKAGASPGDKKGAHMAVVLEETKFWECRQMQSTAAWKEAVNVPLTGEGIQVASRQPGRRYLKGRSYFSPP